MLMLNEASTYLKIISGRSMAVIITLINIICIAIESGFLKHIIPSYRIEKYCILSVKFTIFSLTVIWSTFEDSEGVVKLLTEFSEATDMTY